MPSTAWAGVLGILIVGATGCAGTPTSLTGSTDPGATAGRMMGTGATGATVAVTDEIFALYRRGLAALQSGQLEAARRDFDAVLAHRPGLPGPAVNLAIIARQEGDDDAALAMLDTVIARAPDFAPAHHQRGLLLRARGEFFAADEAYARAIELDPDYLTAHFNRAVLNDLFLARPEVALRHFTRYQDLLAALADDSAADQGGEPAGAEDPRVARWIVELNRRVERSAQAGGMR